MAPPIPGPRRLGWWRRLHELMVDELYQTHDRFRRHLAVAALRPIGSGIVVVSALGQGFDAWSLADAVLAVFVVPAAAIAVGLPAGLVILLVGVARPSAIRGGRRGLRPVAVAVGTIGVLVGWWNVVGGLTFAANRYLEDLSGAAGILVPIAYFAILLIALVATAGFTLIAVFHGELSAYGTIDADGGLATIAGVVFTAATLIADTIALGLGANIVVVAIGTIIALAGVALTAWLGRSLSMPASMRSDR